jgi:NADPH-dependent curcumin reductase CurA
MPVPGPPLKPTTESQGVPAFPDVLLKLFAGENIGKLMLAVQ